MKVPQQILVLLKNNIKQSRLQEIALLSNIITLGFGYTLLIYTTDSIENTLYESASETPTINRKNGMT